MAAKANQIIVTIELYIKRKLCNYKMQLLIKAM